MHNSNQFFCLFVCHFSGAFKYCLFLSGYSLSGMHFECTSEFFIVADTSNTIAKMRFEKLLWLLRKILSNGINCKRSLRANILKNVNRSAFTGNTGKNCVIKTFFNDLINYCFTGFFILCVVSLSTLRFFTQLRMYLHSLSSHIVLMHIFVKLFV